MTPNPLRLRTVPSALSCRFETFVPLGLPKCGVLVTLNISKRTWTLNDLARANVRKRLASRFGHAKAAERIETCSPEPCVRHRPESGHVKIRYTWSNTAENFNFVLHLISRLPAARRVERSRARADTERRSRDGVEEGIQLPPLHDRRRNAAAIQERLSSAKRQFVDR